MLQIREKVVSSVREFVKRALDPRSRGMNILGAVTRKRVETD
jgi:hypothetical protein